MKCLVDPVWQCIDCFKVDLKNLGVDVDRCAKCGIVCRLGPYRLLCDKCFEEPGSPEPSDECSQCGTWISREEWQCYDGKCEHCDFQKEFSKCIVCGKLSTGPLGGFYTHYPEQCANCGVPPNCEQCVYCYQIKDGNEMEDVLIGKACKECVWK